MNLQDWDKCFVWMMAAFPSWQADKGVSAVWFTEVGKDVEAEVFRNVVRLINDRKPSPFPCGIFEVKHELKCLRQGGDDRTIARKIFWDSVNKYNANKFDEVDARAREIITKMGGSQRIRMMRIDEGTQMENYFVDQYTREQTDAKRELVANTEAYKKMQELAENTIKRLEQPK